MLQVGSQFEGSFQKYSVNKHAYVEDVCACIQPSSLPHSLFLAGASESPLKFLHVSSNKLLKQPVYHSRNWCVCYSLARTSRSGRTCFQTCQTHLRVAGMTVIEHSTTHRCTSIMCSHMSIATHVAKMWQEVFPVAGVVSSNFPSCFAIILVPHQFLASVNVAVTRRAVNCWHHNRNSYLNRLSRNHKN